MLELGCENATVGKNGLNCIRIYRMGFGPNPVFLDPAYPLGLESLGVYLLGLGEDI